MIKNPPRDLQVEVEKLTGFFRGVCEDVNDPLKAGRIRVRIFGIHTPKVIKSDIEGIPTDELPWAEPCMPIQEGSISGFGIWAVPLQGSHVMVFFENSNPSQPRYFASMPGIPESRESYSNNNRATSKRTDGFRDPDGKYPLNSRLGEPDVDRMARGVSTGTLVDTKNGQLDSGVSVAGGGSWSEPSSPYSAKYPHNMVIATHGGVVIELDSTEGSKRFQIYHPSNTYIECDNSGNLVIKNKADRYEITVGNRNSHVQGNDNDTADGNRNIKVGGNETKEIGGNETKDVGGNVEITVGGNVDLTAGGIVTITASTINLN